MREDRENKGELWGLGRIIVLKEKLLMLWEYIRSSRLGVLSEMLGAQGLMDSRCGAQEAYCRAGDEEGRGESGLGTIIWCRVEWHWARSLSRADHLGTWQHAGGCEGEGAPRETPRSCL